MIGGRPRGRPRSGRRQRTKRQAGGAGGPAPVTPSSLHPFSASPGKVGRVAVEVVCGGILVADHVCSPVAALPAAGHLAAVEKMYLLPGGCACNVASNVARQGVSVAVVGRVGEDVWGRFL